eukprot:TRINITY_DN5670_c0_g1_i1.p1 TRINITY_DN5670_c0_g1~~TRINITY_DN5670_c0_g1_i1.p1  ORF type:complete len:66 (-),score=11.52 TRINITY_DN5670_c0_g1_i1:161-358(-)
MSKRQISKETGNKIAKQWACAFIECSAKHNENIDELFQRMIAEIEKADNGPEQPQNEEDGGCILL